MGYQPTFKPTNNYHRIERLLSNQLQKRPLSTFQELEKFMQPVNSNLVYSYNSLRNRLIKKQSMSKIPILLQKD